LEILKGRDYFGDRYIDGDNSKKDLKEAWYKDVDWMRLAQDRNQLRAVMNTEMNLWVIS
jgi:hypothetical protein